MTNDCVLFIFDPFSKTEQQLKKEFKNTYPNIMKVVSFSMVQDVLKKMKSAKKIAEKENLTLLIQDFEFLRRNEELLKEVITFEGIKIRIGGEQYDYVDEDSLKFLAKFINSSREERKHKISTTIQRKKDRGIQVGNQKISSDSSKRNANKRKTLNAIYNEQNKQVRSIIKEKREQNVNCHQIASYLNEKGILSRYGKKFHSKSITRILNLLMTLQGREVALSKNQLSTITQKHRGAISTSCSGKIKITKPEEFTLSIDISKHISSPIEVVIINNMEEKEFEGIYNPLDTKSKNLHSDPNQKFNKLLIHLEQEAKLLPGTYYVLVKTKGYEPILKKIDVALDIINQIPNYDLMN